MFINTSVVTKDPKYNAIKAAASPGHVSGNGEDTDYNVLLHEVAARRDKDSFIKIYQHFAPRVKSFLMRGGTSNEEADELAQETMLSVWHKAKSFDSSKAAASTWIYTIARNKKIDALRKLSRRDEVSLPDPIRVEDDRPAQSEILSQAQERERIASALEDIPPEQSELLEKSFFEYKSHSEIAEETGLPLGTIKSRIRLALKKLEEHQDVRALR